MRKNEKNERSCKRGDFASFVTIYRGAWISKGEREQSTRILIIGNFWGLKRGNFRGAIVLSRSVWSPRPPSLFEAKSQLASPHMCLVRSKYANRVGRNLNNRQFWNGTTMTTYITKALLIVSATTKVKSKISQKSKVKMHKKQK